MITLAPLPRDRVAEVAHLRLPPAQRGFVGLIEDMTADPDPEIDFHVVRHGIEAIGFFKIDRDFSRIDARLSSHSHGLRGLLIGGQYQRHGHGARTLELLPAYLGQSYPDLRVIYLRVDTDNAAAIRAYEAHGWVKTDFAEAQGRSGPEHLMVLKLGGPNA